MKTNKLLSVVLTLCVLLAAFSLTALAADGETYPIAVAYCVEGDENGVVKSMRQRTCRMQSTRLRRLRRCLRRQPSK